MKSTFLAPLCLALALSSAQAQLPRAQEENKAATPNIPHVVAASNHDQQWKPTKEQQERVVRDALTYLAAKDKGQLAEAYAQFTPDQKAVVSFSKWEAAMRAFYSSSGVAEGRSVKNVTWYKDPANAPAGVYAAVDFSSQFAELSLHCGFIALQMQTDGSFGVAREEENSISKVEMEKLTPEALQTIRAQYRC